MNSTEDVLNFVEALVHGETKEHLNDLQRVILRECWLGTKKTYDSIAAEQGYSANYIKQGVGPKLWRLLSQVFGEKVTKSNFHSVLERRLSNRYSSQNQNLIKVLQRKLADCESERSILRKRQGLSVGESNIVPLQSAETTSKLELPLDNVPLKSPFYIERIPHENHCYQEITRSGAFIRIKAPRQMGKSSLMHRVLYYAKQQNYQTGLIHFQQAESSIINDLDRFLRWFCANLARQLKVEEKLDEYWDEILGAKMSCTCYLQECILEKLDKPLVIALEEVNEIIEHPQIAKEFLTLLRFWHERTKTDPIWQKLRLIMVHSTEIYISLDINQSPLNVGLRIELEPFSEAQVLDLILRHQLTLSIEQLKELMDLVAGHPYLIRRALYHLAKQDLSFDELIKTAATDASIYSDCLHRHLRNLEQNPELMTALNLVLESESPVEIEQISGFKLHSMGLVNLRGNKVTISCDLYQEYFSSKR